jgi:hypothetical protein
VVAEFAPEAFIPTHTSGGLYFMPVRSLAGICPAILTAGQRAKPDFVICQKELGLSDVFGHIIGLA